MTSCLGVMGVFWGTLQYGIRERLFIMTLIGTSVMLKVSFILDFIK